MCNDGGSADRSTIPCTAASIRHTEFLGICKYVDTEERSLHYIVGSALTAVVKINQQVTYYASQQLLIIVGNIVDFLLLSFRNIARSFKLKHCQFKIGRPLVHQSETSMDPRLPVAWIPCIDAWAES